MSYSFNHVHLKSSDPGATADWYVRVFDFTVISDAVRPYGDRFIRCETTDGIVVNISGARDGEELGEGDSSPHHGLEHFGINVDNMDEELDRLKSFGAEVLEGPISVPNGPVIAFVKAPDNVRIELLQLP